MRCNSDHSMTGVSNTKISKIRVFIFVFLYLLLLVLVLLCPGCIKDTSPPDLSSCTRIEIRYPRSTLDYFLPSTALQNSILSTKEKEYIQSIEFFTVNDRERIKAFAHDVSLGSYHGHRRVGIGYSHPVEVRCYRNNEHMISFTVFLDLIITEDWRHFDYPRGLPNLEIIEPPEMRPFKMRFRCGLNMQTLHTSGPLHPGPRYRREVTSYPKPAEWCDAVMQGRRHYMSEERLTGHFKCPSAGEGRCHYAMNPHCEPNSPPETVLLFETKAGWNQHGGPDLFTFDNHDPKGGCVLFDDGTVKFIRTKEELQQLRWK